MRVTFDLGSAPVVLDASREAIAAALDKAIRENDDFYSVAVQIVGGYLAERVNNGAENAVNRAIGARAAKLSTKGGKARKTRS